MDNQDIPVYEVADGELSLYYNYSDQISDASKSSRHVAGDSGLGGFPVRTGGSLFSGTKVSARRNNHKTLGVE